MGKIWKTAVLQLLLLLCCLQVQAQTTGAITVVMPTSGGSLTLHPVGQLTGESAAVLTGAFASSGVSLTDLHDPETAAQLADYARQQKITGVNQPVTQEGTVLFPDLQEGLYLIVQEETASGQLPICPFLAAIPEGENYAVEARPKTQSQPDPTEPDSTTPETGDRSLWLMIPVVACMVFSGIGAGLCLYIYKDRGS